jgi:hypothetical protein
MSESLFKYQTAANILEGAQRETSIFWQDDDLVFGASAGPIF